MICKIKLLLPIIVTINILSSSAFASAGAGAAAAGAPLYWDTIEGEQKEVATELNQGRFKIPGFVESLKESAFSMAFLPAAEFRAAPYTVEATIVKYFDNLDTLLGKADFPDQDRIQGLITGYHTAVTAALKGLEGIVQDFKSKPLTSADMDGNPNASYTAEEVEAFQGVIGGYTDAVRDALPEDFDTIKREIFLNYGEDKNPDAKAPLAERTAKRAADPVEQEKLETAARLAAERAEQERIKVEMSTLSDTINTRVQAKIRTWIGESSMAVTVVSKEDGVFADLERLYAYCFPGALPEFRDSKTPYLFSGMHRHLEAWDKNQGDAQKSLPHLGTLLRMYHHANGDSQELIQDQGAACMNGLNGRLFQKVLEKCAHSPKIN